MIYLAFSNCENNRESQHDAGLRARNKLFELFGISENDVETTPSGKPFLKSGKLGFSVSHSGEAAICALKTDEEIYGAPADVTVIFEQSDGVDIGCDIEEFPASLTEEKMKRLSERFLGACITDPREFTRTWTRGEAYGKYTGVGIADAKNIPSERTLFSFETDFGGKQYFLSICI